MRKALLLAAVVVACAKTETPATDSAATTPPPPPPPAALTAADFSGTWHGISKREGSDSTLAFTVVSTSDSTGKIIFAGTKDSVSTMSKVDGDSVIVTSAAYKDPSGGKNAPMVKFRSVGHLKDGKMTGVSLVSPAAKPDTVVARVMWEATKAP